MFQVKVIEKINLAGKLYLYYRYYYYYIFIDLQ